MSPSTTLPGGRMAFFEGYLDLKAMLVALMGHQLVTPIKPLCPSKSTSLHPTMILSLGGVVFPRVAAEIRLLGKGGGATFDSASPGFGDSAVLLDVMLEVGRVTEGAFTTGVEADEMVVPIRNPHDQIIPSTQSEKVKKKNLPVLSTAARRRRICMELHAKLGSIF